MVAAMDAIKVFKKQRKTEQRERPLDAASKKEGNAEKSTSMHSISTTVTSSTATTPPRRAVANKAHAYYYFPRRKEVALNV